MIFHKSWHFLHEIYPGKAMQLNLHSYHIFNIFDKGLTILLCTFEDLCGNRCNRAFSSSPSQVRITKVIFVKICFYSVWIPGRPRDRSASSDSTLIHGRQWRENVCPACHVLHYEGKDLHLQKLGAGHCQNEVSHSWKHLYSYFVLFFKLILI